MEKKFIEWDLPLKEISEQSKIEEGFIDGHPIMIHKWWAKRPLAATRVINFSTLKNLPDNEKKRHEIYNLIEKISPWKAVKEGNNQHVKRARELIEKEWDEKPRILDPFAGRGIISLEALRFGCEVHTMDYNPVAVLMEKALVEWPQKFNFEIPKTDRNLDKSEGQEKLDFFNSEGQRDQGKTNFFKYMINKWGEKLYKKTQDEIEKYYPEENNNSKPIGYFWVRTIPCQNPSCSAEIPLVKRFWLSNKKNKKIAYKPIIDKENEKVDFKILKDENLNREISNGFDPKEETVSSGNAECLICGQITDSSRTKELAKNGKMNQRLLAVVYQNPEGRGKKYRLANKRDKKVFEKAKRELKKKIDNWDGLENPLPNEKIPNDPATMWVTLYGIEKWREIYNDRQLLINLTFIENLKEIYYQIKEECKELNIEKYGVEVEGATKAIVGSLSLVADMIFAYCNTLTRWKSSSEAIMHVYSRKALPLLWDFIETNPFSGSTGSFESRFKYFCKSIDFAAKTSEEPSIVRKGSATDLPYEDNSFDAILTDPPYYDNCPYAYLSDLFYVWLKRAIGEFFPNLFSTPTSPKSKEIIADKFTGGKTEEFFERELSKSFQQLHRVLKDNGIASIVYAHKTTSGWETLLNSLISSGFVVTASWPLHTEMKSRLRSAASASLSSSIYMVCRKTNRDELGFWKDIKPQIKERVEEKLQQFWNKGIVGGDFFISAIGPGMEIYSQYENVERYSGEEVTTLDLLKYVRSLTTDFVVNSLLKEASTTEVDSASQFYLAYRWTYLDNKVEFDDARRIASGMGIEVDEFSGKHGFVKQARKYTSVLGPQDREEVEKIDNMVDVMHKCVLLWDEGKQDEIKRLLSETGYGEKPAFWQFCQAVAETLLNGNKEKQLLEGFLTGKDKYSKSSKEDEQTGLDQFGGA